MDDILVTGGLGTIGQPLVTELESRGHNVWVLDTENTEEIGSLQSLDHRAEDTGQYYRCDVGEYRQLGQVFRNQSFDYVYHLAAIPGRWAGEDYYEGLWRTNVVGTKHILRLQREYDFRLILFSSSEVYGDYDGIMSEDVPFEEGVRLHNDYAMSKWVNEQQALNAQQRYDLDIVRVRPINIYGPPEKYSEYRSVVSIFCYRALSDMPYDVFEDHSRTFTYIQDFVRTCANIVNNFNTGEAYNIASEEYYGIKELSDTVLDCLGKDDSKITYKGRHEHTALKKDVSIEKAKRDLNHDPQVTLEEGVSRYIDWMKDHYDLEG